MTFEKFGEIHSAKVSIDANFKSRGYGFVDFKKKESSEKAIEEMDGYKFSDEEGKESEEKKPLIVSQFLPKKQRA